MDRNSVLKIRAYLEILKIDVFMLQQMLELEEEFAEEYEEI